MPAAQQQLTQQASYSIFKETHFISQLTVRSLQKAELLTLYTQRNCFVRLAHHQYLPSRRIPGELNVFREMVSAWVRPGSPCSPPNNYPVVLSLEPRPFSNPYLQRCFSLEITLQQTPNASICNPSPVPPPDCLRRLFLKDVSYCAVQLLKPYQDRNSLTLHHSNERQRLLWVSKAF